MLTTILASAAIVALAEIGDKTMLLAILLASRFDQPWRIVGGILVATAANHLASAFLGAEVAGLTQARWFHIAVALGFLAMAAWTLVPDRLDEDETPHVPHHRGAFITTAIAFFLVEMGDKTQIATIMLGARFHSIPLVATGTTLGMMLVDGPAVFLGQTLTRHISLKAARMAAAALFAGLGAWQLWGVLG